MSNKSRGARAAAAAMLVVAVMAMSAMSADAAVKKTSRAGENSLSRALASLRQATANFMIRYWEPWGELPIINIPRGGGNGGNR